MLLSKLGRCMLMVYSNGRHRWFVEGRRPLEGERELAALQLGNGMDTGW